MNRKAVSGIMLAILLIVMFSLASNIQPVKTEPTTIIVPDDYQRIQWAVGNASDGDTIFVRSGIYYENATIISKPILLVGEHQSNTTINVQGEWAAFYVSASNISISGFTIKNAHFFGIQMVDSFNNAIYGNCFQLVGFGIYLEQSSNNTIEDNIFSDVSIGVAMYGGHACGNTIRNNSFLDIQHGVSVSDGSSFNVIDGNIIIAESEGVDMQRECVGNIVSNNIITVSTSNGDGIYVFAKSDNNVFKGNMIVSNGIGIRVAYNSRNNKFYHNSIDSMKQVVFGHGETNSIWDDGYPSGGNHWSDYNGTDLYSGPYQNETGSDGIGDTPYVLNANNTDLYPLMNPWVNIAIADVSPYKSVITEGYLLEINVTVENHAIFPESFDISLYANSTVIGAVTNVTLMGGDCKTITFTWNTTGLLKGNYVMAANASQVFGELNLMDNIFVYDAVSITFLGDVNADGRVRVDDILAIALAFGSSYGDSRYDPNLDINSDGKVRIDDVYMAVEAFGSDPGHPR